MQKNSKQVDVKHQDKYVGAGLVIRLVNSQFLLFKTRPTHVVRTYLISID
jgi:hypothetical protein